MTLADTRGGVDIRGMVASAGRVANEAAGAAARASAGAGGGPDRVETVRAVAGVLGVTVEGSDPVTMLQVCQCTSVGFRRWCGASRWRVNRAQPVGCATHTHGHVFTGVCHVHPPAQVVLRDVRKRVAAQRAGAASSDAAAGADAAAALRPSAFPAGLATGSAWHRAARAPLELEHSYPRCPHMTCAACVRCSQGRRRCSVCSAYAVRGRPTGTAGPSKRASDATAGPYGKPKDRQPPRQGRAIAAAAPQNYFWRHHRRTSRAPSLTDAQPLAARRLVVPAPARPKRRRRTSAHTSVCGLRRATLARRSPRLPRC